MGGNYDTSWDLIESNDGYLPVNEDAFQRKYEEWKTRDWPLWCYRSSQGRQTERLCSLMRP